MGYNNNNFRKDRNDKHSGPKPAAPGLHVIVRNGDVGKALRIFKKKVKRMAFCKNTKNANIMKSQVKNVQRQKPQDVSVGSRHKKN